MSFIIKLSLWQGSGQFNIHGHILQMRQQHFFTLAVVSDTTIEKAVAANHIIIYNNHQHHSIKMRGLHTADR